MKLKPKVYSRRDFIKQSAAGAFVLALGPNLFGCSNGGISVPSVSAGDLLRHGPLQPANAAGVRVPAGFTARVIATSGQRVAGTDYEWVAFPDGGATFSTDDGGFVYVANKEIPFNAPLSGVGAIRFDGAGQVVDAYEILGGSAANCSGGKTPWGTWLSAEEHDTGIVWECDPFGEQAAVMLPALGVFKHEAVAVDPVRKRLYLTEDTPDGRFYRFTADRMRDDGWPDLTSGTLQALQITSGEAGAVTWTAVPDPSAATTPTREQVPETSMFNGGEGVWYHDDEVFFTTKGDDRIWAHDVVAETIEVVYDAATLAEPILTGVDFLLVTEGGDMVVGEDGGDMQVVAIDRAGTTAVLAQIEGHDGSEITGIAFDPSLSRMIFSSQRGSDGAGVTYMVEGNFFGMLPG